MKIRTLRIENFGIFTEKDLDFKKGSFHLLFGENEAGKTTLLSLLRYLLFGFPHRCDYQLSTALGEMSASARVTLLDGTDIEFHRRKGRKNTVYGQVVGTQEPIDEETLKRLLGNAHEQLYKNIFAFSLGELAAGESSLKDQDLRDALFGSGLGGFQRLEAARAQMDEELQSLFTPRGSKKTLNRILATLSDKKKDLRSVTLRPTEYAERELSCQEAEQAVEEARHRLESVMSKRDHIENLLASFESFQRLETITAQRSGLPDPKNFPDDGESQLQSILRDLEQSRNELEETEHELDQLSSRLKEAQLKPAPLQHEAEIARLHKEIDKIVGFRRDIPIRKTEARRIQNDVEKAISLLNPDWGLDVLHEKRINVPVLAELEELSEEQTEQERLRERADGEKRQLERRIDTSRTELAGLTEAGDEDELELLRGEAESIRLAEEKQDELREELATLRIQQTSLRKKLSPPLPTSCGDPTDLPIPRAETIQDFLQKFEESEIQLQLITTRCQDATQALDRGKRELSDLVEESSVPGREDLATERQRRDKGWSLIHRAFVIGEENPEEIAEWVNQPDPGKEVLPALFEQSVKKADHLADQRLSNADRVAEREQKEKDVQLRIHTKELAESELLESRQRTASLCANWHQAWEECGFIPLSPKAMSGWRQLVDDWRDQAVLQEKKSLQLTAIKKRLSAFKKRLFAALPGKVFPDTRSALRDLSRKTNEARERASKRDLLEQHVKDAQREIVHLREELVALEESRQSWDQRWNDLLQRLHLPTGTGPGVVVKLAQGLEREARRIKEADGLEHRVERMLTECADFEDRVRSLCVSIAPDLSAQPAEIAADFLHGMLQVAREAALKARSLKERLEETQHRRAKLTDRRERLIVRKESLLSQANARSPKAFLQAAVDASLARDLDREIEDLQHKLTAHRGEVPLDTFQRELGETNQGRLSNARQELDAKVDELQLNYQEALKNVGQVRRKLEELSGASRAAHLLEEIESLRADLRRGIDRYVPLALSRSLIKAAMSRFEREHQPAMLREVSRLMSKMTGGRYPTIQRRLDREGTLLAIQSNGTEKDPGQLSTGTREQLYLSIRLAYIRHYCRNAEPLPIVMDDVLVNFDDTRARNTLEVLREFSADLQIIFLTCHEGTVARVQDVLKDVEPIRLVAPKTLAGRQSVLPLLDL